MSPNQLKCNISSLNVVNENTILIPGENQSNPDDTAVDATTSSRVLVNNKLKILASITFSCLLGLIIYTMYNSGRDRNIIDSEEITMLSLSSDASFNLPQPPCTDLLIGVFDETCISSSPSSTRSSSRVTFDLDDVIFKDGISNYQVLSFVTNNIRQINTIAVGEDDDGGSRIKFWSHGHHLIDNNDGESPTSTSNCIGHFENYSYKYEDETNYTTVDDNADIMKYSFNTLDGGKTIYMVTSSSSVQQTCLFKKLHGKKCRNSLKLVRKAHKDVFHKIRKSDIGDLC